MIGCLTVPGSGHEQRQAGAGIIDSTQGQWLHGIGMARRKRVFAAAMGSDASALLDEDGTQGCAAIAQAGQHYLLGLLTYLFTYLLDLLT